MLEAEKLLVVLVLHSIGWHLHDCIITFINPAGENGKELCKQCGCSGRFVNARTLWLTENYCCTAARWVTIGTCVFCWSAKCQFRFVYNFTPQTVKKILHFKKVFQRVYWFPWVNSCRCRKGDLSLLCAEWQLAPPKDQVFTFVVTSFAVSSSTVKWRQ